MATLSGTLYKALGINGNIIVPSATNGVQGRVQADAFALSDNGNADFSGTGTTVTYNADAIAYAALDLTGNIVAGDLASPTGSDNNVVTGTKGDANDLAQWNADGDLVEVTMPLGSSYGGTGNAFTKFTGPTTAERTFTLPDSSQTLAYSGGAFHDGFSDYDSNDHIDHTGVDVTAGAGMTGGGDISATRTLNVVAATNGGINVNADSIELDIADLSADTPVVGDFIAFNDIGGGLDNKCTITTLTGIIDHNSLNNYEVGQHRIINDAGTSSTELWSASKISTEISALSAGIDWQDSVLDIVDNTAVPPSEVEGNRYILDDTGASHANWDGADPWDLVEFESGSWVVKYDASADEGGAAWVEDVNKAYTHNGTSWTTMISVYDHNNLASLQGGTSSEYYHLTSSEHTEITTILANTDITGAQLETLSDGSDAGSLHVHDSDYFTETELGSTTASSEGALLIGTDTKTNLGSATSVEAAITACDTHVGASNPHSGSAASGANSDILSITGLTTPLAADQGGTGTAAPTEDAILVGETGGTWNLKTLANGALKYDTTGDTFSNAALADLSDVSGTTGSGNVVLDTSPTINTPAFSGNITIDEATNDLTIAVNDQTTGAFTATIPSLAAAATFAFLEEDQTISGDTTFSGETTMGAMIMGGNGGTPNIKAPEYAYTVLNPGGTATAGNLAIMDSSGQVTNRTGDDQVAIGTFSTSAAAGQTAYVTHFGVMHYLTDDSPNPGDALYTKSDGSGQHKMTTTVQGNGAISEGTHIAANLMLFFGFKLMAFQ